jgi:hypothetical protein
MLQVSERNSADLREWTKSTIVNFKQTLKAQLNCVIGSISCMNPLRTQINIQEDLHENNLIVLQILWKVFKLVENERIVSLYMETKN